MMYDVNMPPKNRISVTRNVHMPRRPASRCCSMSSNWRATAWGWVPCASSDAAGSLAVVVGVFGYDRNLLKIFGQGRRLNGPFKTLGAPGIRSRGRAVTHRPDQIDQRDHVADAQNRGAGGRHHVEHLKFLRVDRIAARHPQIAENELGKEREVEPEANNRSGDAPPEIGIKPPA